MGLLSATLLATALPAQATVPFYPMGIIEIKGTGTSQVSFSFTGFVPDLSLWTCTFPALFTVECTPPPAPGTPGTKGMVNVCQIVIAEATNNGLGSVTASSRCVSGPQATATSNGPTNTSTIATAVPATSFPWRCSATVAQGGAPLPWIVRCTVQH